jgi:hypothetical protein
MIFQSKIFFKKTQKFTLIPLIVEYPRDNYDEKFNQLQKLRNLSYFVVVNLHSLQYERP